MISLYNANQELNVVMLHRSYHFVQTSYNSLLTPNWHLYNENSPQSITGKSHFAVKVSVSSVVK